MIPGTNASHLPPRFRKMATSGSNNTVVLRTTPPRPSVSVRNPKSVEHYTSPNPNCEKNSTHTLLFTHSAEAVLRQPPKKPSYLDGIDFHIPKDRKLAGLSIILHKNFESAFKSSIKPEDFVQTDSVETIDTVKRSDSDERLVSSSTSLLMTLRNSNEPTLLMKSATQLQRTLCPSQSAGKPPELSSFGSEYNETGSSVTRSIGPLDGLSESASETADSQSKTDGTSSPDPDFAEDYPRKTMASPINPEQRIEYFNKKYDLYIEVRKEWETTLQRMEEGVESVGALCPGILERLEKIERELLPTTLSPSPN